MVAASALGYSRLRSTRTSSDSMQFCTDSCTRREDCFLAEGTLRLYQHVPALTGFGDPLASLRLTISLTSGLFVQEKPDTVPNSCIPADREVSIFCCCALSMYRYRRFTPDFAES